MSLQTRVRIEIFVRKSKAGKCGSIPTLTPTWKGEDEFYWPKLIGIASSVQTMHLPMTELHTFLLWLRRLDKTRTVWGGNISHINFLSHCSFWLSKRAPFPCL